MEKVDMFEMFRNKKGVVIVTDEKTSKFGDYLMQLISIKDDTDENIIGIKDGSLKAVHISDKQYLATKAEITSDEKVIFIGDNKLTSNDCAYIGKKYHKFGMWYGWLGNRALLKVDKDILTEQKYKSLVSLGKHYEKKLQDKRKELKSIKIKNIVETILLSVSPILQISNIIKASNMHKEEQEQQYALLTFIFFMDALQEFLEE